MEAISLDAIVKSCSSSHLHKFIPSAWDFSVDLHAYLPHVTLLRELDLLLYALVAHTDETDYRLDVLTIRLRPHAGLMVLLFPFVSI